MPAPTEPVKAADLPEATKKSGAICSIACNLPHGLTIIHKGKKLTLRGGNHKRAIITSEKFSGKWGLTHNVDEEWFDDWAGLNHPALRNGLIVKNSASKIEDQAEAMGDAIPNGVDAIDPSKKIDNVEKRTDKDDA